MITLDSQIRISMEELNIAFSQLLNEKREELERMIKDELDSFDFEEMFRSHIRLAIERALEEAFRDIRLTDSVRTRIWNIIEKEMEY